jgi:hypothetical protein
LVLYDDEATWCGAGDTRFVSDATHDIQFDRPDVVIRAIREVVAESVAK